MQQEARRTSRRTLNLVMAVGAIASSYNLFYEHCDLYLSAVFSFALVAMLYSFFQFTDKKENRVLSTKQEVLLATLLSVSTLWGGYMARGETLETICFGNVFLLIIQAILFSRITLGIVRILCEVLYNIANQSLRHKTKDNKRMRRDFFLAFFSILILWLPIWLAYYPGLWNYDPWQVDQFIDGNYTKHHPLLHTVFISACYSFGLSTGDAKNGVILYDLIQSTIMAAIFAFVYAYIKSNLQQSRIFSGICLAFYALAPIHSILAISTTKDVLFSGFILLALIIGIILIKKSAKKHKMLCGIEIVVLALIALLRNNASYCLYVAAFVSLIMIRKQLWRRCFLVLAASIIVYTGTDVWITKELDAKPVNNQEKMSVIAQQFGRIYERVADDEDRLVIEKYVDVSSGTHYNQFLADPMKSKLMKMDDSNQIKSMVSDSWKLFLKHKKTSIDSFLFTTKGIWDLGDSSHASIYGTENSQGYLLTDVKNGYGITTESKILWLYDFLENLFTRNDYQKIPIISIVFSPSLYVYIFIFCAICLFSRDRKCRVIFPFFFALGGTIMLGPCILIRYVYPFVICAPVFMYLVILAIRQYKNENVQ